MIVLPKWAVVTATGLNVICTAITILVVFYGIPKLVEVKYDEQRKLQAERMKMQMEGLRTMMDEQK